MNTRFRQLRGAGIKPRFLQVVLPVVLLLVLIPAAAREKVSEAAVKTAFLYNFTQFIGWPEKAFHNADTSFHLCFFGSHKLGNEINRLSSYSYQGRSIQVKTVTTIAEARDCQLLYLAADTADRDGTMLRALSNFPVLTVSSIPDFVNHGGMIGFIRVGDNIRFEINRNAMDKAGLSARAVLLEVASRVLGGSVEGGTP